MITEIKNLVYIGSYNSVINCPDGIDKSKPSWSLYKDEDGYVVLEHENSAKAIMNLYTLGWEFEIKQKFPELFDQFFEDKQTKEDV